MKNFIARFKFLLFWVPLFVLLGCSANNFGGNGEIYAGLRPVDFAVQASGEVVVGYQNSNASGYVVGYNSSLSPDTSFGSGGQFPVSSIGQLFIQGPDLLIESGTDCGNPLPCITVTRYNFLGVVDPTFGVNGVLNTDLGYTADLFAYDSSGFHNQTTSLGIFSDLSLFIAGTSPILQNGLYVNRYTANGQIEPSFGQSGTDFFAYSLLGMNPAVAFVPNGDIWTTDFMTISALTSGGALDSTFGNAGVLTLTQVVGGQDVSPTSIAVQSDGQILIFGINLNNTTGTVGVARLTTTGTIDTTFGTSGFAYLPLGQSISPGSLTIQPDGKILVSTDVEGGTQSQPTLTNILMRLNTDGSVDSSFGVSGEFQEPADAFYPLPRKVLLQSNGDILELVDEYSFEPSEYRQSKIILVSSQGSLINTIVATSTPIAVPATEAMEESGTGTGIQFDASSSWSPSNTTLWVKQLECTTSNDLEFDFESPTPFDGYNQFRLTLVADKTPSLNSTYTLNLDANSNTQAASSDGSILLTLAGGQITNLVGMSNATINFSQFTATNATAVIAINFADGKVLKGTLTANLPGTSSPSCN